MMQGRLVCLPSILAWIFTTGRSWAGKSDQLGLYDSSEPAVGNAHAEPHIPCYLVQKLNILMHDQIYYY